MQNTKGKVSLVKLKEIVDDQDYELEARFVQLALQHAKKEAR